MANFTTDGKICIEREIEVTNSDVVDGDILSRFDIIPTCKWIEDNKYERVCLQFPDDLLGASVKIYEEIKNRVDVDLYILGDTSYASCCVDVVAAMHVKGEAVIHYGHSCFSAWNIPVFTVLPKRSLDMEAAFKLLREHSGFDDEKLCLFYDAEFYHYKDTLTKAWFTLHPDSYIADVSIAAHEHRFLGRVARDSRGRALAQDGLADCVCVYMGSKGQTLFNYTISIAAKDWYLLDPGITLSRMDETTWFKRRRFLVEKCRDATVVGVLVCQLGAQTREIVTRLQQLCRVNGKKSYIVSVGKPNVAKLANFPEIDIYAMVACPENDLYSNRDFYKPIVYPFELEVALNSNREAYSTTHVTDYGELLPGRKYYRDIDHVKQLTDVSLITGKIRETKVNSSGNSLEQQLEAKQNWALENIGQSLRDRSWQGLEQKLGVTEVKLAEEGRKGIPLQYNNEPE